MSRLRSLPAYWRSGAVVGAIALLMLALAACGGGGVAEPAADTQAPAASGDSSASAGTAASADTTASTDTTAAATQEPITLQVVCINRTLRPC